MFRSGTMFRSVRQLYKSRATSRPKSRIKPDVVIVGAGPCTTRTLKQLALHKFPGNVVVISQHPDTEWMQPILHEKPCFPLGQSRATLAEQPPELIKGPREFMPISEFRRNLQYEAVEAVEAFIPDQLTYIQERVQKVFKTGPSVILELGDGSVIETRHAVFATGLGPERDLASAGVTVVNPPRGPRLVLEESTTAIKSFLKPQDYFSGQNILVYGAGATGAWTCENAYLKGADGLTWMSKTGFETANPYGRNNAIMKETEKCRITAEILKIKYLENEYTGYLDTGSGIEVTTVSSATGKIQTFFVDKTIAAIGANPLAPTGIQHILGTQIYNELEPSRSTSGFVAHNPDMSVIVTIAPVYTDLKFQGDFGEALAQLPEDARLAPGIAAVRQSANAAVELITGIPPGEGSGGEGKALKSTATTKPPDEGSDKGKK